MDQLVDATVWFVAFLFSTTLHEAAHAAAALRGGDPTAYRGGQVSIDPLPHIRREPFGMLILPLASLFLLNWPLGFASTPYDPAWARRHPRRAAWMSLAGPAANLLLMLLAALAIRVGVAAGIFEAPVQASFQHVVTAIEPDGVQAGIAMLLSVFLTLNLILFLFNLLPVPPLDGSGALPLLLPAELGARVQAWLAQPLVAYAGLLLAWFGFPRLVWPTFQIVLGLLYPGSSYE